MKVTGIYGGSFNPIHMGHLTVARETLAAGAVDEVWLTVSRQNPLKERYTDFTDAQRLELARLAVEGIAGVEVSDVEFTLPAPSYTYITLRELSRRYPDRRFRLIVGSDSLESFSRWAKPDEIAGRYGLIVYPRPGHDSGLALPPGSLLLSGVKEVDVSSTQVRRALEAGEPLDGLVPPAVARRIAEYRTENLRNHG